MRVLVVLNPEKSIFMYLAPLAWALRTAGHEVRVASQPGFAGVITQAGLTAVPVGHDHDPWEAARQIPGLVEASRAGLPVPYDIVADPDGTTWEDARYGQAGAAETADEQNAPILDDLVEFCRHWRPDLVLWEPFTQAGAIAAAACGAAHARVLFSVDVFAVSRQLFLAKSAAQPARDRADPLADWYAGYARKYDFPFGEELISGHFTVDQFPASLQLTADGLRYLGMQYVPYGGPAEVPRWLWEPPERPRVALTLGLTATEIFDGYNVPLAEILRAVAELDVELVATVAEREQAKLGPLPGNVRVVPYVPWHAIVPTCAAVIHHGGAATLATTARHPVPHLALHYHFDQPILARKLAAQGAGLEIHTSRATAENVRESVRRLLDEPAFARAAAALRDEMLALPTPNQLVPQLEALTAEHTTLH
jgi:glycosyltransferase (activator-dependent family)